MVATDVYRPAAIEQLHKLGERAGVPVYDQGKDASPVDVARKGVTKGRDEGFDAVIIDTAGRLQASLLWVGLRISDEGAGPGLAGHRLVGFLGIALLSSQHVVSGCR